MQQITLLSLQLKGRILGNGTPGSLKRHQACQCATFNGYFLNAL
jgi:hypothetical protein